MIIKNRDRDAYSFANINLLGKCNANCYFCLGKDIADELAGKNQLATYFQEWKNFGTFLAMCEAKNINKLYLTGQTADGLQYHYLEELVDYLQNDGFTVGVRTNGYLALRKMHIIQKMKGEIGYSIHSLEKKTSQHIMYCQFMPDWNKIIPQSGDNVRVSVVVNRFNVDEIEGIVGYLSKFDNVRYIQLRRISTETRYKRLEYDILLFEKFYEDFKEKHAPTGEYAGAPIYRLFGKDVVFWRTVETRANSLNYFTDGTCSDEYFVVEGYLKYSKKETGK